MRTCEMSPLESVMLRFRERYVRSFSNENEFSTHKYLWHATHVDNFNSILEKGLVGRGRCLNFTDIAEMGALLHSPDWAHSFARLSFNRNNMFVCNRRNKIGDGLVVMGFSYALLSNIKQFAVSTHGLVYSNHEWCKVFRGATTKKGLKELEAWLKVEFDKPAKSRKNFWSRGKVLFDNSDAYKGKPSEEQWACIRMAELLVPLVLPHYLQSIICSKDCFKQIISNPIQGKRIIVRRDKNSILPIGKLSYPELGIKVKYRAIL